LGNQKLRNYVSQEESGSGLCITVHERFFPDKSEHTHLTMRVVKIPVHESGSEFFSVLVCSPRNSCPVLTIGKSTNPYVLLIDKICACYEVNLSRCPVDVLVLSLELISCDFPCLDVDGDQDGLVVDRYITLLNVCFF